jgi:hypothetical protein
VKVGRETSDDDRYAVDVGHLDNRRPLLWTQHLEATEKPAVLVGRRDVEAVHQHRPVTLNLLREEAPSPAFSDRLEELVLGDEFCACHRPQRTHTLGTAERRRAGDSRRLAAAGSGPSFGTTI